MWQKISNVTWINKSFTIHTSGLRYRVFRNGRDFCRNFDTLHDAMEFASTYDNELQVNA